MPAHMPMRLSSPVFAGAPVAWIVAFSTYSQTSQVRVFSPSFLNVAFLVTTHLPKVWASLATVISPQQDHFCSWVVFVVVHFFAPVWFAASFSPYFPPQSLQVACSTQVAVPPEQLRWRPSTLVHGLEELPVRLG